MPATQQRLPVEGRVTEEQANAALTALLAQSKENPDGPEQPLEPPPTEAPAGGTEETPKEPAGEGAEPAPEEAAASDDVESLKKRLATALAEKEQVRKEAESRVEAVARRHQQNEEIIRARLLRKSTVADRALEILRKTRSEQGVPETEVDRVIAEIQSTMNPASSGYAPLPPEQVAVNEDQAIVLNNFLNEKAMSETEAEAFAKWMKEEAAGVLSPLEQAVASRDLDGFLRLAHGRFHDGLVQKSKEQQRSDAVGAVKSVQRTQREAARAATAPVASPTKRTSAPAGIDTKKLTKEDISKLLQMSVEQESR